MGGLVSRIAALPRAVQWVLLAGAVLAAYLGIVEPLLGLHERYASEADRAAIRLAELRGIARGRSDNFTKLDLGARYHGEVRKPVGVDASKSAVESLIEELFQKHDVPKGWSFQTRTAALTNPALRSAFADPGRDENVYRLVYDLSFEATPEQVSAVLADLERSPVVHAVGHVVLRVVDGDTRRVAARIEPEVWVVQASGGGRR